MNQRFDRLNPINKFDEAVKRQHERLLNFRVPDFFDDPSGALGNPAPASTAVPTTPVDPEKVTERQHFFDDALEAFKELLSRDPKRPGKLPSQEAVAEGMKLPLTTFRERRARLGWKQWKHLRHDLAAAYDAGKIRQ